MPLFFNKRDPEKEAEALAWISTVTRQSIPAGMDYGLVLRNGVLLCQLMNTLSPGAIPKVHTSGADFKFMENVNNFTKACRAYGVPDTDIFQTVDLWEGKELGNVTATIYALGRTTYKHPEWPGPWLGPRPAEECKREFSEETIAAGKTYIGLQAGSNKGATQAGENMGATRKVILNK